MHRLGKLVMAVAVIAVVSGSVAPGQAHGPAGSRPVPEAMVVGPLPLPPPAPAPAPARTSPTLVPRKVSIQVDGFYSWALLNRKTKHIAGARTKATNSTESMIKVWLVADYLRRQADKGRKPTAYWLGQARRAIRDSDDNAAERLYRAGGGVPVIRRLNSICRLTETRPYPGWWSRTQMSARDAVRMGACIADGRGAGKKWTKWVLGEMRKVRGSTAPRDQHATSGGGRWGIIDGLPKAIIKRGVGIKNGWTAVGADGKWHVNCLAVGHDWVLAVLMRYPVRHGLKYGANVCKSVAAQLVARPRVAPAGPIVVGPAPGPD